MLARCDPHSSCNKPKLGPASWTDDDSIPRDILGRAIRLALDLQGILHLAQRVQEKVYQAVTETEAVVTGEGMEETLVGKSSLGESSSEAETGEDEAGEVQGDPDDFFAGLS